MKPLLLTGIAMLLLSACEATQPEPYQADRAPENRDTYNGIDGLVQKQKDQNYLMKKERAETCSAAQIDLAVAESKQDTESAKIQKDIIKHACG